MEEEPVGELTMQTIAMPGDTNPNGDIFGGWLLSQMDLAAGIMGKRISKGRITTVALNSMSFLKPVKVGDIVACYASLLKTGTTSMTVKVDAWVQTLDQKRQKVTSGIFVIVAIDKSGRPRKVANTNHEE